MGQATYTPPRGADDPEIQALVAIFSHGEGLKVLHETIQYLVERSQDEDSWLKALAAMDVPTTFIWGVYDTVSPPRVVNYVWNEFMMKKPGRNTLYFVPDANHYLQNDQPSIARRDHPARARRARRHATRRHRTETGVAAAGRPLSIRTPESRRPPEKPGVNERTTRVTPCLDHPRCGDQRRRGRADRRGTRLARRVHRCCPGRPSETTTNEQAMPARRTC